MDSWQGVGDFTHESWLFSFFLFFVLLIGISPSMVDLELFTMLFWDLNCGLHNSVHLLTVFLGSPRGWDSMTYLQFAGLRLLSIWSLHLQVDWFVWMSRPLYWLKVGSPELLSRLISPVQLSLAKMWSFRAMPCLLSGNPLVLPSMWSCWPSPNCPLVASSSSPQSSNSTLHVDMRHVSSLAVPK